MIRKTNLTYRLRILVCATAFAGATLALTPDTAHAATESVFLYNAQHQLVDMSTSYYIQQGHVYSYANGMQIAIVSQPTGAIIDQNNVVIGYDLR